MEFYQIDGSNIGEQLDPHAKSLIKEDLTELDQVTSEKEKISKNDSYINVAQGNNSFRGLREDLGKTGQSPPILLQI